MGFAWLGHRVVRHRTALVVIALALTAASVLMLPRLRYAFRAQDLFVLGPDAQAYQRAFEARYGTDDNTFLVVVDGQPGAMLTPLGVAALRNASTALATVPGVVSTYDVTHVPRRDAMSGVRLLLGSAPQPLVGPGPVTGEEAARVREAFEASHLIRGRLVSDDASTALILVTLAPELDEPTVFEPVLADIERKTAAALAEADPEATLTLHFGGLPYVRTEALRQMQEEQLTLWPLVSGVYFAILLVVFRRLWEAVLPLVVVGFATAWTMGLMAATGQEGNMLNNTLPTLILVIGVSNAVHIVLQMAEARRYGATRNDAIRLSVAAKGLPALLTTATTAIGFASLLVARTPILQEFGVQVAAAMGLTYVAIITAMPALAAVVGGVAPRARTTLSGVIGGHVTRWLVAWPRLALVVAVAVLGLALLSGSRVVLDTRVTDAFRRDHPVVQTNDLIERELGGILPLELELVGEPGTFGQADAMRSVAAFQAEVSRLPGVLSTLSPVDLIAEVGGGGGVTTTEADDVALAGQLAILRRAQAAALSAYLTPDLARLRLTARLPDAGIRRNLDTIGKIDALAEAHFGRAGPVEAVHKTGVAYASAVGLDAFVVDIFLSLVTATGVILVVLVVAFRSFWAALLSALPNLLPLAVTLGLMPIFGYELNVTTAIVFTIAIGMSVDNSIHLLSRFRSEMGDGKPLREAILTTFAEAGQAVVTSNVMLVGGFAVLLTSAFEPVHRVGVLTVTTIAASAVAALLVIPAELALYGRHVLRHVPASHQAAQEVASDDTSAWSPAVGAPQGPAPWRGPGGASSNAGDIVPDGKR